MDLSEQIKSKGLEKDIQCAFCLNPNASNQKAIVGKKTSDGKDAVAFLCDDHKDQVPKFAHQISDSGKVTMVSAEELSGEGGEGQGALGVMIQEQQQQSTEVTAKKIASDVK